MPGKQAFGVEIIFAEASNPPRTKRLLEEDLRRFVMTIGLRCYLGPFGGMTTTYGFVWSEDGERDLYVDRDRVEAWLRTRPMTSLCKLGDLEDFETTDINKDMTGGPEFEVDNLTDGERAIAAQYWGRL